MANFFQHVAALLDPTVAINKEGYLVNADGFFDSGSSSTDYISVPPSMGLRDFLYGPGTGENYLDSFSTNDTGAIDQNLDDPDVLYDKIMESTAQQNAAAQSSADRAMEFNAEQAELNRAWQAEQNQKAMDFSERMSNTSYQRAMEDLRAAGLNPKLAAKLGGAAAPSGVTSAGSVASGSAAQMTAANLVPLASVLSSYITGADALDRQNNDFVQRMIGTLISVMAAS